MTPFLKQVAQACLKGESGRMADICFVFPNKRSSLFFSHYMMETVRSLPGRQTAFVMPEATTIDNLVGRFSPTFVEATRYEQLFTLFREYRRLAGGHEEAMEFDRFRFWGDMLLSDFNDIDRNMVDARGLFVNLSRLREINSTFLTEEQQEIIRTYWGEDRTFPNVDRFWTHISHTASKEADDEGNGKRFIKLWQILAPLYENFHKSLELQGLATPGRMYRLAAESLKKGDGASRLVYSRYVFVGFNVLTAAESAIFEIVKRLGKADFYWDLSSPAFSIDGNRAMRLVKANARKFKSRNPIPEEKIERLENVSVVAIPSRQGQAKYVGTVIKNLIDSGRLDPANAINTAVVLPDEALLPAVIEALPKEIREVNVTMGFPMKNTPVASLIRRIVSMHLRARSVKGEFRYFYEDVLSIASHPLVNAAGAPDCRELNREVSEKRLFTISWEDINRLAPEIAPVFRPVVDTRDFDDVTGYVEGVLGFLRRRLQDALGSTRTLVVLDAYADALDELRQAASRFGVSMDQTTVFHLLENAINTATVSFKGEPLKGLQIMGVLETRSLDFDNVIIPSMNERIFPRRHVGASFIPEALRRGFAMPTTDMRESTFAYYFYRLLSRASSTTLLYDSRTTGGRSNEKSRYLSQLLYLLNDGKNVVHTASSYKGTSFSHEEVVVEKTPRIMALLNRFTRQGSGKNLSASSINNYINCPLEFYLKIVEGLDPQDEMNDYMDASTFGTVMHRIVETLYSTLRKNPSDKNEPVVVTKELLERFLNDNIYLERLVTTTVNELYNRTTPDDTTPLAGDAYAMGRVILLYVKAMIRQELKIAPFTFLGAEVRSQTRLRINDNLSINFTQVIDRIDRVGDRLRIVDYKTGDDMTSFSEVKDLFTPSEKRKKAVLQLLLYCGVYAMENNTREPIQPLLYKFLKLPAGEIEPLKYGKAPLMDYHEVEDEFKTGLKAVIEEIFNPDIPFTQATYPEACTFCKFKSLCGRDS